VCLPDVFANLHTLSVTLESVSAFYFMRNVFLGEMSDTIDVIM
jgi:hypothetical protein